MTARIAVIGVGMAGAALASSLDGHGLSLDIFEKSRGVGGRMATRRAPGFRFDHGAPGFAGSNGSGFSRQVDAWTTQGVAAEWQGGMHVGLPGMSGPAKALLGTIPVRFGERVEALRREEGVWQVGTGDGPDRAWHGPFDILLSAAPAVQIAPVLSAGGIELPELAAVEHDPCWTLMAGWAAPTDHDFRYREGDGIVLKSIIRNGTKPGREGEAWVVHAAPDWSRDWLEIEQDDAAARLWSALQAGFGGTPLPTPTYITAHRWRYARTARALGQPCLWRPEIGLGLCGDWCLGPDVSDAWTSGRALADDVVRHLRAAA